jgi:hypothetical protein
MAEDRGITHWDPPPPRVTAFVVAGALILASLILIALDQLTAAAGAAFVAVVAGLFNLGQTFRMNLRVDMARLNQEQSTTRAAEKGGGGLLPDPPPPRLLKAVAAKSAAISFALAGGIAALSQCEALPYLLLALLAAVVALLLDRRK